MLRKTLVLLSVLAVAPFFAAAIDKTQPQVKLSAAEIVDKNISARGGLQAWRSVQSLAMSGKMEAGGSNGPTLATPVRRSPRNMPAVRPSEQVKLPFVMELKRPLKSRVEIQFRGQTAVQVFDGTGGWKFRPFLNRKDVEPYTPEEVKTIPLQSELDGPLVDYAAKGNKVELVDVEKVEGRDTYKLKVTLKSGEVTDVWIDAGTFLEAKVGGSPRRLDGKYHSVEIYYRDYRVSGSLKFPYLLETRVLDAIPVPGAKNLASVTEKVVLDKVEVNPKLSDSLFTKASLEAEASGKPAAMPASYSHP
jgi:hypothetical protein